MIADRRPLPAGRPLSAGSAPRRNSAAVCRGRPAGPD